MALYCYVARPPGQETKFPLTIFFLLPIDLRDVQKVIEKANKWIALVVKTLANTGLHISELIDIKPEDFKEFNQNYLKIGINGKCDEARFIFLSS